MRSPDYSKRSRVDKRRLTKKDDMTSEAFMKELIEPCECGVKYHRICIREKIVKKMIKNCPDCQVGYSVGFSDCYALRNRLRPNYLAYMLVQEVLFFLSIIAFSEVIRQQIIYLRHVKNPFMNPQWYFLLQTLTTAVTGFALVVFFLRLKGIYCVREIEDIIVFDKSQKQELDFDSPAILSVFFQDILNYECEQKYYKKSITDRYMSKNGGLLGTSLQRVRNLIQRLNLDSR